MNKKGEIKIKGKPYLDFPYDSNKYGNAIIIGKDTMIKLVTLTDIRIKRRVANRKIGRNI
jgi:hypothetical protein